MSEMKTHQKRRQFISNANCTLIVCSTVRHRLATSLLIFLPQARTLLELSPNFSLRGFLKKTFKEKKFYFVSVLLSRTR